MFTRRFFTSLTPATTRVTAPAVAMVAAPTYMSLRLCASTASAPVGKGNFFAFFDLPKQPALDNALLQKRYHALQRKVHPDRENANAREEAEEQQQGQEKQREDGADRSSSSTDDGVPCGDPVTRPASAPVATDAGAKHSSLDVSTYANVAYETLKDPFFRCRYLARLEKAKQMKGKEEGGSAGPLELTPEEEEELIIEDDRRALLTRVTSPNRPLSEDFLMEMLMMNELIFAGDRSDAGTLAQMKVLLADLKERHAQYFEDASAAWAAHDMDEFFGLIEEWTYIHNALTHLRDRL